MFLAIGKIVTAINFLKNKCLRSNSSFKLSLKKVKAKIRKGSNTQMRIFMQADAATIADQLT